MAKLSRKEEIVRAARARAAIMAILSQSEVQLSKKDITERVVFTALDYTGAKVDALFKSMRTNKLIIGVGKRGSMKYHLPSAKTVTNVEAIDLPPMVGTIVPSDIRVTLNKATGALRLAWKGLNITLEIEEGA